MSLIPFRTKQQREVAISLKQAITSHRALHHIAWGTKKELLAKIHAKPIHSYTSGIILIYYSIISKWHIKIRPSPNH